MNKEACKKYGRWFGTLTKNGINNVCSYCTDKKGCELYPKIMAEAKR